MSEADASPIDEAARQDGSYLPARGALAVVLALIGVCGAAVLALVASKAAEPLVLTVLAALATVGVFFLFALAAHHVHFGRPSQGAALAWKIIEAIDEAVVVTDRMGRPLAVNEAFRVFAGTNALGEANTLDAVLSLDRAGAETMFRLSRAAERGQAAAEEVLISARDDGAAHWLKISVKPFKLSGSGGRATAFLWRVSDITGERHRQNDALSAVETRLARYASLPLGLMTASGDGHVTHMNARLAQWLGYPQASNGEMIVPDLHLAELVADGGARLISTVGEAEDGPRRLDLDLISEDGRRWPATLFVGRVQDGTNSIAVFERPVDDIGVKGLRGSGQRFSRLFQSAPLGIALIDSEGRIVSANTAFNRLLLDGSAARGSHVVDAMSRGDSEIAYRIDAALDAARDGMANIPPFDITLGAKGKEVTRRVYTTSIGRGGQSDIALIYVLDVTEAKALEQKVAQAEKMEAVGTLAGGIAHDFNNVLTAIIGFSDLLLQTHRPGDPAYAHIISIKSSANRAAGLVRQLLAFSRRQTLQPSVLQMSDVLTDLSMMINRYLGEKIELKIVSGRDLWFAKADRSEIERSIVNLAVNARDAMEEKGGRLTLRTRNVSERESQKLAPQGVARGEYVMIEVEDTGSGMTPDVMAKIFDPFFTTKAVGKGTGLGLASVYGIMQQTGGYIIPESTPGVGTTFRLYLPRHHVDIDEEVEPAAAEARKSRALDLTGTGRVLLVEDEDAVRRFAVTALKSKGYEVLQACDGVEAIEVMQANGNQVDIVVSDVMMPEMDGPTLMKELRKIDPKLKFIFVSGYPDDAFKNSLDPEADFAFLPKPYSLAQIAAKVKEQLSD